VSFSSIVKNELCRIETNEKCCLLSELSAVVRISGIIKSIGDNGIIIKIVTENAAFARRVFLSIKRLYNIYPEVAIRRSKKLKKHTSYIIQLSSSIEASNIIKDLAIAYSPAGDREFAYRPAYLKKELKKTCCRKSYLRGAFLAGGSISDPEKTYHLEITMHQREFALEICDLLAYYKLNSKVIKRKGNFVVYLKEGENIVDFLNIIGAHSALLELENVRILKGMRNNINRIVNCETANLEKTVNASLRQKENIRYIKDTIGFGSLPDNLREIAEARLSYSDANLKELGEMLDPPLGKSGVNHRLRKLDKIAGNIRNLKGEL